MKTIPRVDQRPRAAPAPVVVAAAVAVGEISHPEERVIGKTCGRIYSGAVARPVSESARKIGARSTIYRSS
jgi:hypothetical protein